jgi:Ca2+-binding RTX toxin-like protein
MTMAAMATAEAKLMASLLSLNDWLVGDSGDDFLVGKAGNDTISGGAGADRLLGGGGRDALAGGGGVDILRGGSGKDMLRGNAGADNFAFATKAEAASDRIVDFRHTVDDIDLRGFMKNGQFIGSVAFSGTEGDVRYVRETGVLSGDITGDGKADWSLIIANKALLTGADFLF